MSSFSQLWDDLVIQVRKKIFQQLACEIVVKTPSSAAGVGFNLVHTERRAGDPSAVAGASILASLSNLRQDLSRLKPTAQNSSKTYQMAELPPSPVAHEDELDGLEVNSATNIEIDSAADVGATSKILPLDCNLDSCIGAGNIVEERELIRDSLPLYSPGMSLRCAVFKEDIHEGILDGRDIQVSFDAFPYYLSENTKNVLIAASYIHLKHREQVKFTAELPTVNPRILLSGSAGSEIYQEMLAKALANYCGAKLLIFDSHLFLGGLSAKEAELQREGNNAEKSSNIITKQSSGASDLATGTGASFGEAVAPSASIVPSTFGLETQQKMEIDTIPSSVGASKNPLFKLGT